MNSSKAFIRNYKYEFTAFAVNVSTASITYLLTDIAISFLLTVIVFTLSMFVVIYFRTRERDFYYLPLNKPGSDSDWVGRGVFKFIKNEKCYEITSSSAGFIYPGTALWDDYYLEFDFKIIKTSIGVIFRAQKSIKLCDDSIV